MGSAEWEYKNKLVYVDVGFPEWTASSDRDMSVTERISYLDRNGRIVQTIHYSVSEG